MEHKPTLTRKAPRPIWTYVIYDALCETFGRGSSQPSSTCEAGIHRRNGRVPSNSEGREWFSKAGKSSISLYIYILYYFTPIYIYIWTNMNMLYFFKQARAIQGPPRCQPQPNPGGHRVNSTRSARQRLPTLSLQLGVETRRISCNEGQRMAVFRLFSIVQLSSTFVVLSDSLSSLVLQRGKMGNPAPLHHSISVLREGG